jgi:hypothetical protein
MYVCMCVCVCMYVCMCVCVCMYVCVYVCMYVCMSMYRLSLINGYFIRIFCLYYVSFIEIFISDEHELAASGATGKSCLILTIIRALIFFGLIFIQIRYC